jgi:hypothetical protein
LLARADAISSSANTADDRQYFLGLSAALRAQAALLRGQVPLARSLADVAREKATVEKIEGDFVRAARLQGLAALATGEERALPLAHERLTYALARARTTNLIQEELALLTALAELQRRRLRNADAHELLREIWTPAEVGPYPLLEADARLVLARLQRDVGERGAAVEAATRSYELAWCDGLQFAEVHILERAAALLRELGAEPPQLGAFDRARATPLPAVEINPRDEFHVG